MTSTETDPDIVAIRPVSPRTHKGCAECLRLGTPWVHFLSTDHPIVQSLQPRESWRWCYVHENYV